MEVTDEDIVTEAREMHSAKALSPIEVTDEGIVTEARALQPWKACCPMDVIDEGIVTDFRELQPEKARFPMDVTDEGIVTEARELQPTKACSPMEVTDEGMSTFPFASGVYRQAAEATQLEHTSARTVRTRTHSQDRAPRRCQAPALVRPISGRGASIAGVLASLLVPG